MCACVCECMNACVDVRMRRRVDVCGSMSVDGLIYMWIHECGWVNLHVDV